MVQICVLALTSDIHLRVRLQHVISVDLFANDQCDANILVSADATLEESAQKVLARISRCVGSLSL